MLHDIMHVNFRSLSAKDQASLYNIAQFANVSKPRKMQNASMASEENGE